MIQPLAHDIACAFSTIMGVEQGHPTGSMKCAVRAYACIPIVAPVRWLCLNPEMTFFACVQSCARGLQYNNDERETVLSEVGR